MDLTVLSVLGPLVTSAAATVVIVTSWWHTRERWLAWLAVLWGLWVLRYVLTAMPWDPWPVGSVAPGSLGAVPTLLVRDVALALALRELRVRWALPALAAVASPVAAWLAITAAGARPAVWVMDAALLLHALFWMAAAVELSRTPRMAGGLRHLASAAFVLHAVVVGSTIWTGDAARAASFALGLSTIVHLAAALGFGVGARQRLFAEVEAATARRMRALEFVVRGMVPMCAYCRSVRDASGAWTTLEGFVAQRTAAPVAAVRCPECAAKRREPGRLGAPRPPDVRASAGTPPPGSPS